MLNVTAAAQATYDAFNRVGLYNEPSFETDRKALAATLRKLTEQLGHDGDHGIAVVDVRDILHVADELEGIKYGTYRSPWPRQ